MEKYNIDDLQEFSSDKRIRKTLSREGKIAVDLVFYEPGQGTPEHKHLKQDEVFYIISGKGTMIVGGQETTMREKDIIVVPSGEPHGVRNDGSGRLIMMFVKNSSEG